MYDIPVTGYWDREELAFTAGVVADFLERLAFERDANASRRC